MLAGCVSMHESELMELREQAVYQKQYDKLASQGSLVPFKGFSYSRTQFPIQNTRPASESSLNNLILLDSSTKLKPKDILKNHATWRGSRFKFAPPTDRFYTFIMPDKSMEPKFAPGDALLVDTQIQKDTGTVVIKLKGSDQMCRIASKDGQNTILRAFNPDVKEPIKIINKKSDFEWIYPVVGLISKSV